MLIRNSMVIFLVLATSMLWATDDEFNSDRLPIGNPETKYNFCAVKLNQIFDTSNQENLSLDRLLQKLSSYQIIMLGESHTSEQHHKVQLNIIKGLTESGSSVCLALEMFNEAQNPVLDDYISGKLTEEEFLDQSDYFNTWGHNYRYYKPIFDFAREHHIKMYGVNIAHEYSSKIGRGGIESLTPEEQEKIPQIDTTDVEHRFYIKAAMEGMDALSPSQFSKIYAAQCLWDAAMGDGAIRVAKENPGSIVLILVGSGHVAYNLGIGKIIKKRSDFPFASVIAIDVPDTMKESVMMQVKKSLKKDNKEAQEQKNKIEKKMPSMKAMHGRGAMDSSPYRIVISSLADFLWGVPEEKQEKYPSFGFSVNDKDSTGFKVKMVIPETIAQEKGMQRGDIILAIDGKDFPDKGQMKKYLSFKNWGEDIAFKLVRDKKEIELNFKIEE